MAGNAPDDANPTQRPAGEPAASAFAATVAPEPSAPPSVRSPTTSAIATHAMASSVAAQATLSAPAASELPALPVVSAAHYGGAREVARGGMGRIVAAVDHRLGRAVALKELLEPSPEQLGRFHREALITARLQHPGIVPVYEAGRWPSGEPFFAMKLVSGRPLDRVIADATTLEHRLALLPQIAAATDAIAYAHSQRVIHRDLKPANILVGDFGETVVIDWGLAKSLDDLDGPASEHRVARPATPAPGPAGAGAASTSTLTVAGAVMGTPAYMAPEQARGEPVDQRVDVFALGAMLYHLLAGVPPYNARTATEVIAAAALGRVVPLASRERGAPVDLVAIVHRAMAPLPIDRYRDAGELASELRRFLTGQLVSAHHYTSGQRLGRFARRHRAAVTIAALAAIGFGAGGTFAVRRILHERDGADQARQLADTRRVAAEHLIDKMLSDVKSRLQQIGRLDVLASLGGEIRDYYATLARTPGGMPADDLDRMALAVDLVGLAERDSGKLDQAFTTWSDARATLAGAVGERRDATTMAKRRMIAHLDFELGTIHQQRGKLDAAVAAYRQAKQELAALHDEAPGDRGVLLGVAEVRDRLGDLLRNEGKLDDALVEYAAAKTFRERAATSPGSRPLDELIALSASHLKLGSVLQVRGDSAKALDELRAALRLRATLRDGQRDDVELQHKLLDVQLPLADLLRQVGDPKAAIEIYGAALPAIGALTRRDPDNTAWRRLRGNLESDFGLALLDAGSYRAALDQLTAAITSQESLVNRDPQSTVWQADLSRTYTRAGDARIYLGELDRGLADYQRALAVRLHLVAQDPRSVPFRRSVGWSHAKLANLYATQGDLPRAIEAHERALALRAALVDESPAQGGFRNELAVSEAALGRLIALADPRRARQLIDAAIGRARALVTSDPINNDVQETLVQALVAEADAARAGNDPRTRASALAEALGLARRAAALAPDDVHWPALLAEIHVGQAELAAARRDPAGAAAAWKLARDALEPLARAGRLPAQRKALYDRARAGR
jgi:tetratricopeptide (TPR) repeat protein